MPGKTLISPVTPGYTRINPDEAGGQNGVAKLTKSLEC